MRIIRTPLFENLDRRGSPPALTAEQREYVGGIVRRRREIRQQIRSLEIEFAGLPTNEQLVAEFGVTVTTLHKCAFGTYVHAHPLDKLPTITPGESP